jgi:hypothetical protein
MVELSSRQQLDPISSGNSSQVITSIAVPQRKNSTLLRDAHFGGLSFSDGSDLNQGDGAQDGFHEMQVLLFLINKANFMRRTRQSWRS